MSRNAQAPELGGVDTLLTKLSKAVQQQGHRLFVEFSFSFFSLSHFIIRRPRNLTELTLSSPSSAELFNNRDTGC